jgi:rhomboid protease GluP
MVATIDKYVLHGGIYAFISKHFRTCNCSHFVEPLLGRKIILFCIFYLDFVEATSIWWYPNSISVEHRSITMGFMVQYGLLLTNAFPKAEKNTNDDWIYVGINTLGLTGGIDNAAHIGGLLSGALIGIILYKLDDGRKTA